MAWIVPVSRSQDATVINITNGDDVFVANGILINSNLNPAIVGSTGTEMIVAGTVTAATDAISLGTLATPATTTEVHVRESGYVKSFNEAAIQVIGTRATIENQGLLEGPQGIILAGTGEGSGSTINNSGSIVADVAIIADFNRTETVRLNNTGLIEAFTAYFANQASNQDVVSNTGRIIGDIGLSGGNDRYSGAAGRLNGTLFGGEGHDTAIGGVDNDDFRGGDGNDMLTGNGGNDTLSGESDKDVLSGGIGKDILAGDAGNDALTGGAGTDKLTGGLNADRFVFNSVVESRVSSGRDTILDFSRAQGDKIQLNAIDANVTAGGNQAFKFIGSAAFTGHAGELRTQKVGTDTHIFADTNGDKLADFSVISNVPVAFVKADFIL